MVGIANSTRWTYAGHGGDYLVPTAGRIAQNLQAMQLKNGLQDGAGKRQSGCRVSSAYYAAALHLATPDDREVGPKADIGRGPLIGRAQL